MVLGYFSRFFFRKKGRSHLPTLNERINFFKISCITMNQVYVSLLAQLLYHYIPLVTIIPGGYRWVGMQYPLQHLVKGRCHSLPVFQRSISSFGGGMWEFELNEFNVHWRNDCCWLFINYANSDGGRPFTQVILSTVYIQIKIKI